MSNLISNILQNTRGAAAAIMEIKALGLLGRFEQVSIIKRSGSAWRVLNLYGNGETTVRNYATLAEAKDEVQRDYYDAEEARADWYTDQATERFYEQGTSAQQMAYQAELDAEAQALGWDPMVVGAFGPDGIL